MAEQPRGALSAVRACLWPPGRTGASIGAFLVPGVALWLPSGYSWGAAWLLLCALAGMHQWWRRPLDARAGGVNAGWQYGTRLCRDET